MKHKKKVFVLFIFLNLILLLQSCKKDDFIIIDYPSSYYVTKNNTKLGYQFAYNKVIDEFEIGSFKTKNKKKYTYDFIKEVNQDGSLMKINKYYIYGIVFDFGFENDYFESFDIKINNSVEKTRDLNMRIKSIEQTANSEIIPLSVPSLGNIFEEVDWVILPLTDIKITSINVINAQNISYSLLVNSIEYRPESYYSAMQEIEKNASFEYDSKMIFNYMYLSISYVNSNNEEKIYNTDFALFGNSLDILRSKI